MASIIDSFKEVAGDKVSFFKLIVFVVPVYFTYRIYFEGKDWELFLLLFWSTLFFLFGFLVKVSNNVIMEKDKVLPYPNPFVLALASIKGILAIGPLTFIGCLAAVWACSFINIIAWLDITLKVIIWMIVAALIINSFLMFAAKEKIIDAFNLKLFFENAGDLFVTILIFIIQISLANLFTVGLFGYVIFLVFGQSPVLEWFLSYVFVFNIGVFGHYMGQLHYETLGAVK